MLAELRRWGNSLAIRIPSSEIEAHGLKEGDQVKVRLQRVPTEKVDVSHAPFFRDPEGRTDLSVSHDEIIAEAVWEKIQRTRRQRRD